MVEGKTNAISEIITMVDHLEQVRREFDVEFFFCVCF